jgi:hypothetical protein
LDGKTTQAMTTASRRSRLAFASLLAVLFVASVGGAYLFRKRQLDRADVPVSVPVVAETVVETTAAPTTEALALDTIVIDETTIAADTTAPPAETTAAPPETTAAPSEARELSLTTDGALLTSSSGRFLWDESVGCDSIAQTGSTSGCDRLAVGGVNIAWVLEGGGGATILQSDPGVDVDGTWNVQLSTTTSPTRKPLVADVTGDGEPELLFGYRNGEDLSVDIVEIREGSAGVALHLELPGGRLSAGDGSIEVWQRGDTGFEHWTVERDGGRWVKNGLDRSDSAPEGDL